MALPGCSGRRAMDLALVPSLSDLAAALAAGEVSSSQLVRDYFKRIDDIDRNGPRVNSVIENNPEAQAIAVSLDAELRKGRPRSVIHGAPVLLKDNIATADRMKTTAGSLALLEARPDRDATVVANLRTAGAVILGKTNLSEWANIRSSRSTSGWSARGGQTRNPHVLDHNPSGSSSGSAAAVAAGLCAGAVGTESDGSIVSPASACGIVGLKPTLGLVSRAGIIPISRWQDTAGPMTRSVRDAALLLSVMAGPDARDPFTADAAAHAERDYARSCTGSDLKGIRLGLVRELCGTHPSVLSLMDKAVALLRDLGAEVVDPVELPNGRSCGGHGFRAMLGELHEDLNAFLKDLPRTSVRSLAELIAFNEAHADKEMPHFGQELLLLAQRLATPEAREATKLERELARSLAGARGIDAALTAHRLDALVVSTSDPAHRTDFAMGDRGGRGCSSPAAVAGYPHLTVPMGLVGPLPVGISFMGAAWSEPLLLRVGHVYEQASQARRLPRFLETVTA